MIFYERKKLPRAWSGKKKGQAVVFHAGIFYAEDKELIDQLIKAGYTHKKDKPALRQPKPAKKLTPSLPRKPEPPGKGD